MKDQDFIAVRANTQYGPQWLKIETIAVYGTFAVHRATNDRRAATVSHVPSGAKIRSFDADTPSRVPGRIDSTYWERRNRAKLLAEAFSKIPGIEAMEVRWSNVQGIDLPVVMDDRHIEAIGASIQADARDELTPDLPAKLGSVPARSDRPIGA